MQSPAGGVNYDDVLDTDTRIKERAMALRTISQILEAIPGLTPGGILWELSNAEKNGLAGAGAIFRRGRRILLDEERYLEWRRARSAKTAIRVGDQEHCVARGPVVSFVFDCK